MSDVNTRAGSPNWEALYADLLAELREQYPDLPDQVTESELRVAVDDLEKARGVTRLADRPAVAPHEVLDWALSKGPLAPSHG